MVTNSRESSVPVTEESVGLLGQAMLMVRQSLCGLHGHDTLLHFEQDRMFLRCTSCGHETPGWEIGNEPRADVRFRESSRQVGVPRLVGARKVA
jgi:hypothetical protein